MPNGRKRKKKGGQNKSKKQQAMKVAVQERHERAKISRAGQPPKRSTDLSDHVTYKRGSARGQAHERNYRAPSVVWRRVKIQGPRTEVD
jgi:hypothetical protein